MILAIYLFFCFAFFSIRKHHTLAVLNSLACLNDLCWWKWVLELFPWILATWKVWYVWTLLMLFEKRRKQHFRYQFLIPWKFFMAENHWKSATRCETSIFVETKISSHFTKIEWDRGVDQSWSRPKWFFPKKNGELFGSRVQGTWPSHLFTFHPSKGRPTGPDFNSWYGLVNEHLSTRQTAQKRENISRLGKKQVVDTLSQWNDTTWLLILIG